MTPHRVRALVLVSTIAGLLIGAALIVAQVDQSPSPATIPGPVEWRFSVSTLVVVGVAVVAMMALARRPARLDTLGPVSSAWIAQHRSE